MNPWSVCNIHVYCVMHVHSSSDKLILYSCILSETVTESIWWDMHGIAYRVTM